MNKNTFLKQLDQNGDSVITYISPVSKRRKYIVGTRDFSTPYLTARSKPWRPIEIGSVLLFCWDTDTYKAVDVHAITKVEPLNKIINRNY